MIVSSIEEICQQTPEWTEQWIVFEQAESLTGKVCAALQLGLLFARIVLETDLTQRAQEPQAWPVCSQCGHRLRSKGFRPRQMMTLIGVVR
ncbi:hypothetical protein [Leptothoe sp. PORK10 BA2]|uniref:hypothetical protein n=1 Tax=Leptothoe sp. PORK10 BA2 TaxID=3110254 RepID=UPI002B210C7C|nr:hypothetical protein [Leptothoe sp. PORK10 BA2]MEA5464638.1 hypothetical protein [Leptothoe sp. PORK10 BA2]